MTTRARSIVGDRPEGRPKGDFYPTPPEAVEALLSVEGFLGPVWEPACGDGAIVKVLERTGYSVYATDLYDRGFGVGGVDFLDCHPIYAAKSIITNPPFTLANDFIRRAAGWKRYKIAFLMKLVALEGVERSMLLEDTGLTRVHVFRRRLTMTRNGEGAKVDGMIAFAWFVWEPGYEGRPAIDWI